MAQKMSSVLFARGVNSQANNPLRAEINRVIGLSTALEKRIVSLERELADVKSRSATAGPRGEKGDTGATGPAGPKGDKGDKGDTGPAATA